MLSYCRCYAQLHVASVTFGSRLQDEGMRSIPDRSLSYDCLPSFRGARHGTEHRCVSKVM
ncbi:uncharacterized protein UDID_20875 [Ustilago sp. UG-2017a]|nr:uncharacterized protein UDID_20875 [Ustilago sp. UG-2017a]SPC66240.1 uncharacterized protein UHOD_20875 [Ustilago sp. UG-2017b]